MIDFAKAPRGARIAAAVMQGAGAESVTGRPVSAADKPSHRYLPLDPGLVGGDDQGRRRMVFSIFRKRAPAPDTLPVRRGLYLCIRGVSAGANCSQYVLFDRRGRDVCYIAPVPMRSWDAATPHPDVWPELREQCEEILAEVDPKDPGDPVEYLGWLPMKGVPAQYLVPVDPCAPPPRPPVPAWDAENVVRHPRLAPGLHLAPFRGEGGELLIAAIGQDGALDALWPVTGVGTWNLHAERPPLPRRDAFVADLRFDSAPDRTDHLHVDDRDLASDYAAVPRAYLDLELPRRDVVHICPWRGRVDRTARMVAVTNVFGCVVGFEEGRDLRTIVPSGLQFLRDVREDHANSPDAARRPVHYDPAMHAALEARRPTIDAAVARADAVLAQVGGAR